MTKRASGKFKRSKNDFYATSESAVLPLIPHLSEMTTYHEPCCGTGALINGLALHSDIKCNGASDINPGYDGPDEVSVFDLPECWGDIFITNPPWTRSILHPLIIHLSDLAPTWLLFDADWVHTEQAIPFMDRCVKIVSVGRVSWMGNGISGFDNCAWFHFSKPDPSRKTQFFWRQ